MIKVGQAHGYVLGKVYGMDPGDVVGAVSGNNEARRRCEDTLLKSAATRSDEQRPSMGQDMHKGRRTEIELINGFVAAKGDEVGIPTPVNKALVEAVKKVERGDLPAGPEVVAQI